MISNFTQICISKKTRKNAKLIFGTTKKKKKSCSPYRASTKGRNIQNFDAPKWRPKKSFWRPWRPFRHYTKKMTPKDAQISLKATIFFFISQNLFFEKRISPENPKKRKRAGRPKTWFSGPSIHEISNWRSY